MHECPHLVIGLVDVGWGAGLVYLVLTGSEFCEHILTLFKCAMCPQENEKLKETIYI